MIEVYTHDITVIGSGVAGLSFLKFLDECFEKNPSKPTIALISKSALDTTNTNWAQGGIAAVMQKNDSFQQHIEDTYIAGDHKNDPFIVEKVIHTAPFLMKKLIEWGMKFDRKDANELDLTLEGGHSSHRILHHRDSTGAALQETLINNLPHGTTIFSNAMVINITKDDFGVFHLSCLKKDGTLLHVISKYVVLSTGGLGMLYERSTNQVVSTGDGIFLASKLGAKIKDLSFIQFHPTGLYSPSSDTFLISEAVRGEGAILRNIHHEPFMKSYDIRAELAPRDIVSRSIFSEMKKTKTNFVFLDGTHLPEQKWNNHFPSIYEACIRNKINPAKDYIPISPVQHYACGGIQTNQFGESNVKNLYAIGEVAATGLHGSNRLASNSLLEGLAFGYFSANEIYRSLQPNWSFDKNIHLSHTPVKKLDRALLKKTMTAHVGIVKKSEDLIEAYQYLTSAYQDAVYVDNNKIEDFETDIMYRVGIMMIKDALDQKKNTGVFYNSSLT
ncbi:MAG: FAD-binding protein [Chitinophagia bacterium]|nr:FAD-binding protein [Chitinophagia bacterium]